MEEGRRRRELLGVEDGGREVRWFWECVRVLDSATEIVRGRRKISASFPLSSRLTLPDTEPE